MSYLMSIGSNAQVDKLIVDNNYPIQPAAYYNPIANAKASCDKYEIDEFELMHIQDGLYSMLNN